MHGQGRGAIGQGLGVAHFVKMRHQVVPYAWRILAKCATPKSILKIEHNRVARVPDASDRIT